MIQPRGPFKGDAGEDRIYKAKDHHKKAGDIHAGYHE